ncbi:hypothetical protein Tco_0222916 [Tanacetum coccineum]
MLAVIYTAFCSQLRVAKQFAYSVSAKIERCEFSTSRLTYPNLNVSESTTTRKPANKHSHASSVVPTLGPIPGMTPAQALTAIQTMTDHSQTWHNGSSSRNIDSSSNYKGIDAILSKLDSLGRDMKKLKENVHAIQVGCQLCGGAHLDKECPLNEEVKSMEEVKYGEFGRPFPNNSGNDSRFNKGVLGYDQPSSGERRPSLTEIINKYMEEAAKRPAKEDKWLKKFYQSTETNREAHDKIIQGLETKVRTLTNKVEGRTNGGTFKECKAIFTEDGSPLYTPFYYSPEEIEYFSANSRFSDNERQETDKSGMEEALATLNITP